MTELLLFSYFQFLSDKYEEENELLHIMTGSELNSYILNDQLMNRIDVIRNRYPNKRLTLLVFGLKEFCRANRGNVGRLAFETSLTDLQISSNISHRLLNTSEDVAQVFLQFSKSIAEKPYKYVDHHKFK